MYRSASEWYERRTERRRDERVRQQGFLTQSRDIRCESHRLESMHHTPISNNVIHVCERGTSSPVVVVGITKVYEKDLPAEGTYNSDLRLGSSRGAVDGAG